MRSVILFCAVLAASTLAQAQCPNCPNGRCPNAARASGPRSPGSDASRAYTESVV